MNNTQNHFDRLNLNLLRVFQVIYQERSLSLAAEILSLTPSAISHSLRQLRDFFGDPLFERDGKQMVPTPFCTRIADDIVQEMNRLKEAVQRWDRFDPSESRSTFTIAMPEPLEAILLPTLSNVFAQHAPYAQIISAPNRRKSMATHLQRGQLDLAIDVALPPHSVIKRQRLIRSGWCVVCQQGHTFEALPDESTYLSSPHVAVSTRAFGSVLEDTYLLANGVERKSLLRCQSYSSAFAIVQQSDLLLTLPRQLARRVVNPNTTLSIVALPLALPDVELYAYWHSEYHADRRNSWLREVIFNSRPTRLT